MAERYLNYFRRSSSASALEKIAELTVKARESAVELERAVSLAVSGDLRAVESSVRVISSIEEEGDSLRREIMKYLSRAEVPVRDAEKLARLARRIDFVTDQVKNTALSLELVMRVGGGLPPGFSDVLREMVSKLVEEVSAAVSAVRSALDSPERAAEFISEVERAEHEIDLLYHRAKGVLPADAPPRTVVLLSDLVDEVESAADLCEDATDVLTELLVRLSLPGGPSPP